MDAMKSDAMKKNTANAANMSSAWRWHLRRVWSAQAALWRALILGLILAVGMAVGVLWPEWRALHNTPEAQGASRPSYSSEAWFLAHFAAAPGEGAGFSAAQTLTALATLARQHGVQIESVSQSPRQPRELPLQGVAFDMTLSGAYSALRSFMAAAMQGHPQLGVESWNVNRDARTLRAEVRWVLLQLNDTDLAQRLQPLQRLQDQKPKSADPLRIERSALAAAKPGRDVFAMAPIAAAPASKPLRPIAAPTIAEADKTPTVDAEFLGRMNLGGTDQAMAVVKGQSVLLKVGDDIASGFKVQSFDDENLMLSHHASGVRLKVSRRQNTP